MNFEIKTTTCKCGNIYPYRYMHNTGRFEYIGSHNPSFNSRAMNEKPPKTINKCYNCHITCGICNTPRPFGEIKKYTASTHGSWYLMCTECEKNSCDCVVCGTIVRKKVENKLSNGYTCDYHSPRHYMASAFLDYGVKFPIVSIRQDENGELAGAELVNPPQWNYGMEIEMEYSSQHRPNVSRILSEDRPVFPEIPAPFFIAKSDGSLDSSGVEWVFQPMPYSYTKSKGFKKIFDKISKGVAHTGRCGLHISMGRNLSDEKVLKMQKFFANHYAKFDKITRRHPGNYCHINSDHRVIWSNHSAWVSTTEKRIEFRGFSGATTLGHIQQAMNLVDAWRKFFRSHNKYTWNGFSRFIRKNSERFADIIGLIELAEEKPIQEATICA